MDGGCEQVLVEDAISIKAIAGNWVDSRTDFLQALPLHLFANIAIEGTVAPHYTVTALAIANGSRGEFLNVLNICALCLDPQARYRHPWTDLMFTFMLLLCYNITLKDLAMPHNAIAADALTRCASFIATTSCT